MEIDTRSLKLAGTNFVFLNEGAYGTIFVDQSAGRVRKVLRRTEKDEDHCRSVMQAELDALEIATTNTELAEYVATPFSCLPPIEIVDGDGSDVASLFYTDAGFESAYCDGQFYKIGCVNPPNWPELSKTFRTAGIRHLADVSVMLNGGGNVAKVIDFATREIELWW